MDMKRLFRDILIRASRKIPFGYAYILLLWKETFSPDSLDYSLNWVKIVGFQFHFDMNWLYSGSLNLGANAVIGMRVVRFWQYILMCWICEKADHSHVCPLLLRGFISLGTARSYWVNTQARPPAEIFGKSWFPLLTRWGQVTFLQDLKLTGKDTLSVLLHTQSMWLHLKRWVVLP